MNGELTLNNWYNNYMNEKAFVTMLQSKFSSEGFLTKTEIGVGYGIADLVLVQFNDDNCAIRKHNKQYQPLLKELYFRTLKYIPDFNNGSKPIELNRLIEKTKLSKALLKYQVLRELEKNAFIVQKYTNCYFKINGWVPIAKRVIAVEAKIKDWRRGFYQANRYKSFADKVYLAVPPQISHLVDSELLKKHNVGLLVFDPQKSIKKEKIRARLSRPVFEDKRNLVSEFFWSR